MDATFAEYEFGTLRYSWDLSEGFYQERLKSNHSMTLTLMATLCGVFYSLGPLAGMVLTAYMADSLPTVETHELFFYLIIGFLIPWSLPLLIMLYVAQSLYIKSEQSTLKVTQSAEFVNKRCSSKKAPFRLYTFYCLPCSWQFCLEMLLNQADAIVMDIRGIAKENKGCSYEVSRLSDRDLLKRTTFIIDDEFDKETLLSALTECTGNGSTTVAKVPRLKTEWPGYEGCPESLMRIVKRSLKYEPSEIFSLLKAIYDGNESGKIFSKDANS
jgi:hypothetical protein